MFDSCLGKTLIVSAFLLCANLSAKHSLVDETVQLKKKPKPKLVFDDVELNDLTFECASYPSHHALRLGGNAIWNFPVRSDAETQSQTTSSPGK